MFVCQNSEGVYPYLLKRCRGTCLFVGMLKGYMVRKRLGTPDQVEKHDEKKTLTKWKNTMKKNPDQVEKHVFFDF